MRCAGTAHGTLALYPQRLAGVHQTAVKHIGLAVFLVEPHRVLHPALVNCQTWPVVWAAIQLPAIKGGTLKGSQLTIGTELRQRVVTLIGLKHMAPQEQCRSIAVNGRSQPTAFTRMVGQLVFAAKGLSAIGRQRRINARATIGRPACFGCLGLALINPGHHHFVARQGLHRLETVRDLSLVAVNGKGRSKVFAISGSGHAHGARIGLRQRLSP